MVDPRSAPAARPLVGLLLACHPGPTVAVTLLAGLLAVAAGAPGATILLLVLAFLTGQLSIGWSNDWHDAARDVAVGRRDKPVAAGRVDRRTVGRAAVVAAVLCVPLSLALGWAAGLAHLLLVASGWAYNFRLKRTVWSWLPFAVAFGLLPSVVTLALPEPRVASWWASTAGALLGVGAHLVNVLPDLDDDRATGVIGLGHRLGRVPTSLLAPAVLVAATVLVAFGPPGPLTALGAVGLVVAAAAAVVAAAAGAAARGRRVPLLATVAVALVDVALLLAAGTQLG